ncbi:MAG: hypothetical protein GWP02_00605 [Desulfobulbaceae bacterium]|nr:hypothetical protein [Desulfobulbaceae bacterium]
MTLTVGLLFLLSACQTMSADQDQPARISPATDASRAALQETINEAMHTNVILADDALTDSGVLTIELNPPGTMRDPVPLGRDMGKPIQFRLVLNQSACILIDQRDGTRLVLNDTTCVAE